MNDWAHGPVKVVQSSPTPVVLHRAMPSANRASTSERQSSALSSSSSLSHSRRLSLSPTLALPVHGSLFLLLVFTNGQGKGGG